MGVAGSRDAGTSGAGAVLLRSAQMTEQQNENKIKSGCFCVGVSFERGGICRRRFAQCSVVFRFKHTVCFNL